MNKLDIIIQDCFQQSLMPIPGGGQGMKLTSVVANLYSMCRDRKDIDVGAATKLLVRKHPVLLFYAVELLKTYPEHGEKVRKALEKMLVLF